MKKIFVIIVTYNGMKWIDKCLTCLSASNVPLYPVVIDNCSTDNTVAFIKENHPNVHLIETGENLGFGRANNVGMKYALEQNADGVFLLNQDAYIYPDTIEKLLPFMDEYGIVSPVHLDGSGTILDKGFKRTLETNAQAHLSLSACLLLEDKKKSRIFDVSFINAAAWLLSINIIKNIGGFDPIFFHYGEDNDYCHRVLYHQYKIGFVSNAFVCHDREQIECPKIYAKQADTLPFLIESMNILHHAYLISYLFFFKQIGSIFLSILTFRWNRVKMRIAILRFLSPLRKQIMEHRIINSELGSNWL